MNAAARALVQTSFSGQQVRTFVLSWRSLVIGLLISAVVASACAVIYVTDLNRRLFGELQSLRQMHDDIYIEKGQLLLEQSTWAAQVRVQQIAQDQLDMNMPSSQSVVMIRP